MATSDFFGSSVIRNNLFYDSNGTVKIRWGIMTRQGSLQWNDYTFDEFLAFHPDKLLESIHG